MARRHASTAPKRFSTASMSISAHRLAGQPFALPRAKRHDLAIAAVFGNVRHSLTRVALDLEAVGSTSACRDLDRHGAVCAPARLRASRRLRQQQRRCRPSPGNTRLGVHTRCTRAGAFAIDQRAGAP